jgi:hypothetical protein
MTIMDAPSPSQFAHQRETWREQWENSRLTQVAERVAVTRTKVLGLLLLGRRDEAIALWEEQAPVWESMLLPLREQADRLRAQQAVEGLALQHGSDWSDWQPGDDGDTCLCGYNGTSQECAAFRAGDQP